MWAHWVQDIKHKKCTVRPWLWKQYFTVPHMTGRWKCRRGYKWSSTRTFHYSGHSRDRRHSLQNNDHGRRGASQSMSLGTGLRMARSGCWSRTPRLQVDQRDNGEENLFNCCFFCLHIGVRKAYGRRFRFSKSQWWLRGPDTHWHKLQ